MKKRIVAFLLLIIMMLPLMTSCKAEYKMKMGIILAGDESVPFYNDFIEASKTLRVGFELKDGLVIIKKNVSDDEVADALSELVDEGCEVIVAANHVYGSYEQAVIDIAKETPEVEFYNIGGKRSALEKIGNYHTAYPAIHDGKYLVGIAAGMKLKELVDNGTALADGAKVGYVATKSGDEVSAFNAFYLGVVNECEGALLEVKYADDSAESQAAAAQALIDSGCKIVAQNTSDNAVAEVCAKNGVYNIGHGISTMEQYPDTFIVATEYEWREFFYQIYSYKHSGFKVDLDWVGNFKYDVMQYSDINHKIVPFDVDIRLDQMKAELLSGTRHVFDTSKFTVDTSIEQNEWATVDENGYLTKCGVDLGHGYLVEVIEDGYGYFPECGERSFPYFNLIIDGVAIIDEKL